MRSTKVGPLDLIVSPSDLKDHGVQQWRAPVAIRGIMITKQAVRHKLSDQTVLGSVMIWAEALVREAKPFSSLSGCGRLLADDIPCAMCSDRQGLFGFAIRGGFCSGAYSAVGGTCGHDGEADPCG